jgi:hypothetical protein
MNQRQKPFPLVHVDVGLLGDDVGEAAADTLDGGEANMIFCLPSTLVLSRRRMYWKSFPAIRRRWGVCRRRPDPGCRWRRVPAAAQERQL